LSAGARHLASRGRRLGIFTLINMVLGKDSQYVKAFGNSFIGAKMELTLRNQAAFRIGLFDGFFRVDIMNRLSGQAYLFGFSLTIFDARASLYGGTQYMNEFAKDLSGALDKLQRNTLGALDTLGRRLALVLRKFTDTIRPFVDRIESFLRPVAQFAEDASEYLDTLLDTFDVTDRILEYVEKCRQAVRQLPMVQRFQNALVQADRSFEVLD